MNQKGKAAELVKSAFNTILTDITSDISQFVNTPGKDFTRNRKLTFADMLKISVQMEAGSIQGELFKYFSLNEAVPTTTAFIKQRAKIKTSAYKTLFTRLVSSFNNKMKKYKGFRILAVDGSVVITPPNKQETHLRRQITENYGFNSVHLNALYDIINGVYVDVEIDDGFKAHENEAFLKMLHRCDFVEDCIFLADRGYEAYNIFAHMTEKKCRYVFRAQDIDRGGILKGLKLPNSEFDINLTKVLANKKKHIPEFIDQSDSTVSLMYNKRFDFLDEDNPCYFLDLRIVRVQLPNGSYESIITNLTREEASTEDIVKLYKMRWGIETSFRDLKYSFKLLCFHTNHQKYIEQEIYSKLTMFNICGLIMCLLNLKTNKNSRYEHKINIATAAEICRAYLFSKYGSYIDVGKLISRFLTPIRPGRSALRRTRTKRVKSFQYR